MITPRFLAVMLLVLAVLPVRGQVLLANYTFTGSTYASSDTDANSTASDFSVGSGLTASFSATGNPAPSVFISSYVGAPTAAQALTANRYFAFTLTPSSGYEANLTTLTFQLQITADQTGAPLNYAVFNSSISMTTPYFTGSLAAQSDSWSTYTTDLTGLSALQNVTSPTTFYIVLYNGGTGGTSRALRVDNVSLSGQVVAVPEPSTLGLIVLACIGTFACRNRILRTGALTDSRSI